MPKITDPLAVFMAGVWERSGAHPLPLLSTELDIAMQAGMATVTTRRRFRNAEAEAIEAVMTFPVPVHGALFSLTAVIDGRVVTAQAKAREAAREVYEEAIERGKAAVLHEEVLRGVHMLSVANLRPGGEIEVTTRWVAALNILAGTGHLRIPMTVGDVYGTSGLADSDELTREARPGQKARVRLSGEGVTIAGATVVDGLAEVPMNRPIDVTVAAWTPTALNGRAGDGRRVELTIAPAPAGEKHVHLAVLVDCSGSMNEPLDMGRPAGNKHKAAAGIVRAVAADLEEGDAFDLWEFNMVAREVGRLRQFAPDAIDGFLSRLSHPASGTEIGQAIDRTVQSSEAGDILLITDGKSYALDVQRLAQLGRRISVLLIGEDSLEANVGHLAALTGGDLFFVTADNLTAVAQAILAAVRLPFAPVEAIEGPPLAVRVRRGGVEINAHWVAADVPESSDPSVSAQAVSALAASVALPGMTEAAAAVFAEAEGLVTHLTSLVLVDEVGEAHEGLPATRKIALESPVACAAPMMMRTTRAKMAPVIERSPSPAMASAYMASPPAAGASPAQGFGDLMEGGLMGLFEQAIRLAPALPGGEPQGIAALAHLAEDIKRLGGLINWDRSPAALLAGDISSIGAVATHLLNKVVKRLADLAAFGRMDSVHLALGLAALSAAASNRTAERFAHRVFAGVEPGTFEAVKRILKVT